MDEQESFNKIMDELLSDEFVNRVSRYHSSNMKSNYDKTFIFNPTITTCISRNDNTVNLFYNAKNGDEIVFQLSHKRNLKDAINEMLEIKIPRKLFSEYIQYIIDNNDETKKNVVVQSNARKGINEFYVNDERDAFVLVKKR